MTQRPSADDLKRLWGLSMMPTEKGRVRDLLEKL